MRFVLIIFFIKTKIFETFWESKSLKLALRIKKYNFKIKLILQVPSCLIPVFVVGGCVASFFGAYYLNYFLNNLNEKKDYSYNLHKSIFEENTIANNYFAPRHPKEIEIENKKNDFVLNENNFYFDCFDKCEIFDLNTLNKIYKSSQSSKIVKIKKSILNKFIAASYKPKLILKFDYWITFEDEPSLNLSNQEAYIEFDLGHIEKNKFQKNFLNLSSQKNQNAAIVAEANFNYDSLEDEIQILFIIIYYSKIQYLSYRIEESEITNISLSLTHSHINVPDNIADTISKAEWIIDDPIVEKKITRLSKKQFVSEMNGSVKSTTKQYNDQKEKERIQKKNNIFKKAGIFKYNAKLQNLPEKQNDVIEIDLFNLKINDENWKYFFETDEHKVLEKNVKNKKIDIPVVRIFFNFIALLKSKKINNFIQNNSENKEFEKIAINYDTFNEIEEKNMFCFEIPLKNLINNSTFYSDKNLFNFNQFFPNIYGGANINCVAYINEKNELFINFKILMMSKKIINKKSTKNIWGSYKIDDTKGVEIDSEISLKDIVVDFFQEQVSVNVSDQHKDKKELIDEIKNKLKNNGIIQELEKNKIKNYYLKFSKFKNFKHNLNFYSDMSEYWEIETNKNVAQKIKKISKENEDNNKNFEISWREKKTTGWFFDSKTERIQQFLLKYKTQKTEEGEIDFEKLKIDFIDKENKSFKNLMINFHFSGEMRNKLQLNLWKNNENEVNSLVMSQNSLKNDDYQNPNNQFSELTENKFENVEFYEQPFSKQNHIFSAKIDELLKFTNFKEIIFYQELVFNKKMNLNQTGTNDPKKAIKEIVNSNEEFKNQKDFNSKNNLDFLNYGWTFIKYKINFKKAADKKIKYFLSWQAFSYMYKMPTLDEENDARIGTNVTSGFDIQKISIFNEKENIN